MSDREVIREILVKRVIEFTEDYSKGTITVEGGYRGFCTVFSFATDGSLIAIGAYE